MTMRIPRCTVLVVLLIASVMEINSEVINYSCNPAGTITVENPNATFYTGAFAVAVTGDGEVNCSTVSVFGAIIISDCPISENITLWLTDDPDAIIFSGINSAVYKLRCQQIPATGVYRMVTDESWVTNLVSTEHMPSVTPMIILNTDIIDIESGVSRRTAIVGEPLNWEMDGPGGYSILPVNCTARSGDGEQEINIIYNGCSLDLFLVSHFEVNETIGKHYLLSRLYAFRFPTSVEIQITCDMLGCLNTSTACDFTCPSSDPFRRKRSNYDNIHTGSLTNIGYADAMEQLNGRQPNGFRQATDGTEVLLGQVSLRFNVFDSEDLLISRGVTLVQSWALLSFGGALSYLLLRI